MSLVVAAAVPPVASRSSQMITRWPGLTASSWISRVSVPYSREYETLAVLAGGLFGVLKGGENPVWGEGRVGGKKKTSASIPSPTCIVWVLLRARGQSS